MEFDAALGSFYKKKVHVVERRFSDALDWWDAKAGFGEESGSGWLLGGDFDTSPTFRVYSGVDDDAAGDDGIAGPPMLASRINKSSFTHEITLTSSARNSQL